jgi:hypothetical protein
LDGKVTDTSIGNGFKEVYLGWMHCVVGGKSWHLEARFWLFVDSRYMRRTAFKGHLISQTKVPKDISEEKLDLKKYLPSVFGRATFEYK